MNNHKFQAEIAEAKRRQAQRYKEQKYRKRHHGKRKRRHKRRRLTMLERIAAILTALAVVFAVAFCVCYFIDIKQKVTASKHFFTVYHDGRVTNNSRQSTPPDLFATYQDDEQITDGSLQLVPGEYYRFEVCFDEQDLAAFWGVLLDSKSHLAGPLEQELFLQVRYPNAIQSGDTSHLSVALFAEGCPTIYQDIELSSVANTQLYLVGGWETKFYHAGELIGEYPKDSLVSSTSGLFLSRTNPLLPEGQNYFDERIEFLIYADYMTAGLPDSEFETIADEWHQTRADFGQITRAPYTDHFYILRNQDGEISSRGSTKADRARQLKAL